MRPEFIRSTGERTCQRCGAWIWRDDIYRTSTDRGRELAESLCPDCAKEREDLEGTLHVILSEAQYLLNAISEMPVDADDSEINSTLAVSIYEIEVELGRLRVERNDNLAC